MKIEITEKSMLNLTEEEAKELMKNIYSTTRPDYLPKVKSIKVFDEEDAVVLVTYLDDITERSFLFTNTRIHMYRNGFLIPPVTMIEFLVNHGYLRVEE